MIQSNVVPPIHLKRQISPFIDELKIHRRGLTQRLECLINLFSERPSAVVLPFENPEIKFTNPDFSDFRSQCLEMTDFVFPSFDHQINAAAEMCLEREVTHLELLNKNRVITTRHSNLSSNGHIVFHLFADKIRHLCNIKQFESYLAPLPLESFYITGSPLKWL